MAEISELIGLKTIGPEITEEVVGIGVPMEKTDVEVVTAISGELMKCGGCDDWLEGLDGDG